MFRGDARGQRVKLKLGECTNLFLGKKMSLFAAVRKTNKQNDNITHTRNNNNSVVTFTER